MAITISFWSMWLTIGMVIHLALAVTGRKEELGPWGYPEPTNSTVVMILVMVAWWVMTLGAVVGRMVK